MKTLIFFIFFISSAASFSREPVIGEMLLNISNCEKGSCITISYVNKFNKPLCVADTYFPYDGIFAENTLIVTDLASGKEIKYRFFDPSYVTSNEKNAVLVRLFSKGAKASLTIALSDLFEIEGNKEYRIEYAAEAFFCGHYGDEKNNLVRLSGSIEGILKTKANIGVAH